ncbi:MAG: glutathione S-transferase family protein [Gammaproteobacteria bacterium]
MALELYTHPMSPCAQKVRIVLAEKGVAWTKVHVDLPGKANLEPGYLELNPLGVVPTLVDDGRPVIESSIICEYLDDKYPEPALRPADPWQRARMRFWMKHIDIKLHPACGALQWPLVMADKLKTLSEAEQQAMIDRVVEKPRRERQRRLLKMGYDAPDVADAVRVYQATIADMDSELDARPWLAGDEFSLADAATAPYFQTLTQFGWRAWYEARPRVADWYVRVCARPSYQSGVADDFSAAKLADLADRGRPAWTRIQTLLADLGAAA